MRPLIWNTNDCSDACNKEDFFFHEERRKQSLKQLKQSKIKGITIPRKMVGRELEDLSKENYMGTFKLSDRETQEECTINRVKCH